MSEIADGLSEYLKGHEVGYHVGRLTRILHDQGRTITRNQLSGIAIYLGRPMAQVAEALENAGLLIEGDA